MTKKLKDLFASFSEMDQTAQMEKIREIRHKRSIERPAVAKKRVKKEAKKKLQNKEKLKAILAKMSDDERRAFLDMHKDGEMK